MFLIGLVRKRKPLLNFILLISKTLIKVFLHDVSHETLGEVKDLSMYLRGMKRAHEIAKIITKLHLHLGCSSELWITILWSKGAAARMGS